MDLSQLAARAEVPNSIYSEVGKTLKKMKIVKATGPDNKPRRMDTSTSLKVKKEVR